MDTVWIRLLALPFLIGLIIPTASSVIADSVVPYPPNCEVYPPDIINGLILCPDQPDPIHCTSITVAVRDINNDPLVGFPVEVIFQPGCDIVLCPDAATEGLTDPNGEVEMSIAGGGCCSGVPDAVVIEAGFVAIRSYENAKSPDYDGVDGSLGVDLADLISFAGEFLDVAANVCHDYDNNGNTGLEDLICFAAAFTQSAHCP